MRWTILAGNRDLAYDGVIDHCALLARELGSSHDVVVATRRLCGQWDVDVEDALSTADVVLIEYAPWNFGLGSRHWRFMTEWHRLRRMAPEATWLIFLHEVATPAPRDGVNRMTQRLQLAVIAHGCDMIVGATPLLSERTRRRLQHREVPVGSNLPDARQARGAYRERLGLRKDVLVVGSFLQGYRAAEAPFVTSAVAAAVDAHGGRAVHLALGSAAADTSVEGVRRISPGALSSADLAGHLACVDLYISPFHDGVSARRTSVVAALQHGLPVITNHGEATESWLLGLEALKTVPLSIDEFARAATALAEDSQARKELAMRARAAFEQRFDWQVLVASLEAAAKPRMR